MRHRPSMRCAAGSLLHSRAAAGMTAIKAPPSIPLPSEGTMSSPTTRRDFLKVGALAGAGFFVADNLSAAPLRQPGPNERVNVGVIGAGGQGASDTNSVAKFANIVALCDVDEARAAKQFAQYPKAQRYT